LMIKLYASLPDQIESEAWLIGRRVGNM